MESLGKLEPYREYILAGWVAKQLEEGSLTEAPPANMIRISMFGVNVKIETYYEGGELLIEFFSPAVAMTYAAQMLLTELQRVRTALEKQDDMLGIAIKTLIEIADDNDDEAPWLRGYAKSALERIE